MRARSTTGASPDSQRRSYWLAIERARIFIEPDLVITKDRVLIARHDNEIGLDQASRPRKQTLRFLSLIYHGDASLS